MTEPARTLRALRGLSEALREAVAESKLAYELTANSFLQLARGGVGGAAAEDRDDRNRFLCPRRDWPCRHAAKPRNTSPHGVLSFRPRDAPLPRRVKAVLCITAKFGRP
jgi:hypothetical protein